VDPKETGREDVNWIPLLQSIVQWWTFVSKVTNLLLHKIAEFLDGLSQDSVNFSLPQAALAIHISVDGSRKKLIMWTVNKTVLPLLKRV
jgi:hypothetical protein